MAEIRKVIGTISIDNSDDKCLKVFKTALTEGGVKMPINPKLPLVYDSLDVSYEGATLVPNKLYAFNQTVDMDPQVQLEQDSLLRMLGFDIFISYMPVRKEDGTIDETKMIINASFDVVEPIMIYPDTVVASIIKMVPADENGNEIVEAEFTAENDPVPSETILVPRDGMVQEPGQYVG